MPSVFSVANIFSCYSVVRNLSCGLHGRIYFKKQEMKTGFKLGDFELTWLNGGRFELDGGAMFENAGSLCYHDPFMLACKFDGKGNILEKRPVEPA